MTELCDCEHNSTRGGTQQLRVLLPLCGHLDRAVYVAVQYGEVIGTSN